MKGFMFLLSFLVSISLSAQVPKKLYQDYKTIKVQNADTTGVQHFFYSLDARSRTIPGHSFSSFNAYSETGKLYTKNDLIGKITFINFWFENCLPCISEMNPLNNLYQNFKDEKNFQFLSFTRESVLD